MTSREPDSHNPEGSKTVTNIRTAKKTRKNKNVSWSASNKRHRFTREGHLYNEDVPMKDSTIYSPQGSFKEEDWPQTDEILNNNLIENNENAMLDKASSSSSCKKESFDGNVEKNVVKILKFDNSEPEESIQFRETHPKFEKRASPQNQKDPKVPAMNSDLPKEESQDKTSPEMASNIKAEREMLDPDSPQEIVNILLLIGNARETSNVKQEINDEVKKTQNPISSAHRTLAENFLAPPQVSSIKKVEQSKFSVEQDDLLHNLITDSQQPFMDISQQNENVRLLTTSILLNQNSEDKFNKEMPSQKNNLTKTTIEFPVFSFSPSLQSETQKKKIVHTEDTKELEQRDKNWKEATPKLKPVVKALNVAKSPNEENQTQNPHLQFPFSTDLESVAEISREKYINISTSSGKDVRTSDSRVQGPPIVLLQDSAQKTSLMGRSMTDKDKGDNQRLEISEPQKKKVIGTHDKKVVDTLGVVFNENISNQILQANDEKDKKAEEVIRRIGSSRNSEENKNQTALRSSSSEVQGKKLEALHLKKKERTITNPSEKEDPILKKTKLTSVIRDQNIQVESTKSPFKITYHKGSETNEPALNKKDNDEMKKNQQSSKEGIANPHKKLEKKQEEPKEI